MYACMYVCMYACLYLRVLLEGGYVVGDGVVHIDPGDSPRAHPTADHYAVSPRAGWTLGR